MIRVTEIDWDGDDRYVTTRRILDTANFEFHEEVDQKTGYRSVAKRSWGTCEDQMWLVEDIDEIWRRIEAAQGRAIGDESELIWKTMLRSARLEHMRYRDQEFAADAAKKK